MEEKVMKYQKPSLEKFSGWGAEFLLDGATSEIIPGTCDHGSVEVLP